jgi:ATP-binding cassette subfamily B protein/subfamily B ATP-binding cassette protein MsbA
MGRYRQVLRYIGRQWRHLAAILALTVAASAFAALEPWPIKLLVDHALTRQPLPPRLASLLGSGAAPPSATTIIAFAAIASLGLFAVGAVFTIAVNWLWAVAGQRMVFDLSTDLFHKLQRLSLAYHARTPVGDSLSRLGGDTWSLYTLSSRLFAPFEQLLTLAVVGAVAVQLNARLTLFAVAAAPVLAGASLVFGPRLKARARGGREAQTRLGSFVHHTLACLPLVQAFTAEGRNRQRFRALSAEVVGLSRRSAMMGSAYGLVGGLVTTVGAAFILYLGGREVMAGTLSVGGLIVFLAYLRKLQAAAETLLNTYGSVKPVEANVDRVFEVLDNDGDQEVRDRPSARPLPRRPGPRGVEVRFEDVSFGYQRGRPVLDGVNLIARPGETVALVGATGAGKSTLVSLIPRFHDVWSGRVSWDGMDVRDLKIASLRAHVSLMLQEPFLFPISVAENIAYGRPEASRREIAAAAEAANADAFIRRLPEGYDTVLGEQGHTLSGGERQRLAIARALLKDASLLVLDEPTSALDAVTEAAVVEALQRLMAGRTAFIIAHRLSTIRGADQIAVLDAGRVVDTGTHQQLLARSSVYRRLYALQAGQDARPEAVA